MQRFASNTATTSGAATQINVVITASFGKRSSSVTVAQLDDDSLQRACKRAEEVARISPENPEGMPDLGPQTYVPTKPYFEDVAKASPEWRASAAETAIALSKKKDVVSAGFVETQAVTQAVASSKGLFAYDRYTAADFNLTSRTPDGSGSGWASKSFNELKLVDPGKLASVAIDKAVLAKAPAAIEPGKYTVVLEPSAVADLVAFMIFAGDARQSDEGRSFYSKKGGGNRIGEQIGGDKVTIYSDPAHPLAATATASPR